MTASPHAPRWERRTASFAGRAWRAKLFAPGIALAFAACAQTSTPDFVDPATVTFDYAAAYDASGLPAVSIILARVADARTEVSQPGDVGVEYLRAWDLAFLPAEAPAQLGIAGPDVMPGAYREFLVSRMPYSSCVTAAGGQLRYQGCRAVYPDVTIELDGTFTRSGTALTWNLDLRWSTVDDRHHLVGELDVGSGQLLGHARDDQVTLGYTFTDAVDLALSLDGDGCPVAGTAELKRLFPVPSYDLPDTGHLLAWTGCGVVTVAASTSKR